MTKIDYLIYAIKNRYLDDIKWYYTFLSIIAKDNYKNNYVEVIEKKIHVFYNDERVALDNITNDNQVYSIYEPIKLPKGTLANIKEDIDTTMGYLIVNYILVNDPFNGKIPYINEGFDVSKFEDSLSARMLNKEITVEEYKRFLNNCNFMEKLSMLTTVSATEKNTTIPDSLLKYKADLIKELDAKYGKDEWRKDQVIINEFETKLKEKYDEWVKDDPSNNKFLSGKIKGNSAMLRFLTVGTPAKIGAPGENPKHIKNSLLDGLPEDKEELASFFNVAIAASYSRGKSTAEGGALTKELLRSTSSIQVTNRDCGVTYGWNIAVTESNYKQLLYRYMVVNKKPILLDKIEKVKSYIGKTIEIRSPMWCKEKEPYICAVCAGKLLAAHPTGISLIITSVSSKILTYSMKKMHDSTIKVMDTNIDELFLD